MSTRFIAPHWKRVRKADWPGLPNGLEYEFRLQESDKVVYYIVLPRTISWWEVPGFIFCCKRRMTWNPWFFVGCLMIYLLQHVPASFGMIFRDQTRVFFGDIPPRRNRKGGTLASGSGPPVLGDLGDPQGQGAASWNPRHWDGFSNGAKGSGWCSMKSAWWFQILWICLPFHIWDVILPIDVHIFQDG